MSAKNPTKAFHFRGFTSLLLTLTGLFVAVSGIVLFLAPRGSVAVSTDWNVMGLNRWQWAALHVDFTWIFLAACIVHMAINWRALWGYLRRRVGGGVNLKWELVASVLLVGLILTASLLDAAPFGRHGRWAGRGAREGGRHRAFQNPHAGLSIGDAAAKIGVEPARARALLARAGYPSRDSSETIGDLARRHRVRPRAILDALRQTQARGMCGAAVGGRGQRNRRQRGRGWGWRRFQGKGNGSNK